MRTSATRRRWRWRWRWRSGSPGRRSPKCRHRQNGAGLRNEAGRFNGPSYLCDSAGLAYQPMRRRLFAILSALRFAGYAGLIGTAFLFSTAVLLLWLRWVNHGTAARMAANGPPPDPVHAKIYWEALESTRSSPPVWAIAFNFVMAISRAVTVKRRLREHASEALRQAGRCRSCGYDLRASPGRCPECGAEPAIQISTSAS